jgi:hypothetical protein
LRGRHLVVIQPKFAVRDLIEIKLREHCATGTAKRCSRAASETRSEAPALLGTTGWLAGHRSRLKIAPDQHGGKDREHSDDGGTNENRINGHSYLLFVCRASMPDLAERSLTLIKPASAS